MRKVLPHWKTAALITLPLLLGAAAVWGYRAQQAAIAAEASLSLTARGSSFSIGEPVALAVSFRNNSQHTFSTSEHDYEILDFACGAGDVASRSFIAPIPKPFVLGGGLRRIPEIKPHSAINFDLYLNRYVKFLKPGVVKLDCVLTMPVEHWRTAKEKRHLPDHQVREQKTFTFTVGKPDAQRLQSKLDSLVNQPGEAPFSRAGSVCEALNLVPLPLAIKQLPRLVQTKTINNYTALEFAEKSSSQEATHFIKSTLLGSNGLSANTPHETDGDWPYFYVVQQTLPELSRRKVVLRAIELETILRLVPPFEIETKKQIISYISQIRSPSYGPLLQSLYHDENPDVAEVAELARRDIALYGVAGQKLVMPHGGR